jgi:UDP-N-acetylglucosamine 2-epimerase (non-hydrolysing)
MVKNYILICYGTRPEWIKIKPLIKAFDQTIPFKLLYTGQHEHIGNFHHDYSVNIKKGDCRLNSVVSSILNLELPNYPEYVLVQGDTASTFASALWAFNRGIKIIYLEAGLRTYDKDNPYPEESYRQMISRISSINFCVTENNIQNIVEERCPGKNYVVGNTVLDNLKGARTIYSNEIIVTMHRRENLPLLQQWFTQINDIAKKYNNFKFTIPLHPNPQIQKYKNILSNLNVIEPLPYSEMILKISKCRLLISDSGGLQEEASFLNKKIIVCRKETERQESLGTTSFLCKKPEYLKGIFADLINDYKADFPCPYGDGKTSQKILNILKELK